MDANEKLFCEIALDMGMVTKDQLKIAIDDQNVDESLGRRQSVGAYLLDANVLTKDQIAQIIKMQDKYSPAKETTKPTSVGASAERFTSSSIPLDKNAFVKPKSAWVAMAMGVMFLFFGYLYVREPRKFWLLGLAGLIIGGVIEAVSAGAGTPVLWIFFGFHCYVICKKKNLEYALRNGILSIEEQMGPEDFVCDGVTFAMKTSDVSSNLRPQKVKVRRRWIWNTCITVEELVHAIATKARKSGCNYVTNITVKATPEHVWPMKLVASVSIGNR